MLFYLGQVVDVQYILCSQEIDAEQFAYLPYDRGVL